MALIVCPECGNQISDKAAPCPHCGAPLDEIVDGEIVITWVPNHHFEGARRTTVFVDGRQIAILKCSESASVAVDEGTHAIELWQGKHKILVDTVEVKRSSPKNAYKFKEIDYKGNALTHPYPDLVKYEECTPREKLVKTVAGMQKIGQDMQKIGQKKNIPRCPTCGSEKIRKLSTLGKAVSFELVGFAGKSLNKTFKCKTADTHGEGSRMKTPTPRKLKSGSWTIQLMLGGKKISVTNPTKADCIKEPHMLKANYQAGKAEDARHDYPKQRKTFDTYIDNWQSELSASTTNGYKAI